LGNHLWVISSVLLAYFAVVSPARPLFQAPADDLFGLYIVQGFFDFFQLDVSSQVEE
jgi:hypothetical protein